MTRTRIRNLFLAGCFAAALALTWAGATLPRAAVPTPIAVLCPTQQTEPPTAAPSIGLDQQPPGTVQNLRRADRR